MRLALTGGGTGGHIFPALEVGRLAAEDGAEVRYFGSRRGQEGAAASTAGFPFSATEAEPIPKLISLRGFRSIVGLLKGTRAVVKEFSVWRPDVLLSTGGYSSGPSLRAAKSLGVPIVMHEQNAVPGRSTTSMARHAAAICIVFDHANRFFEGGKVTMTGLPVRRALAKAAEERPERASFTTLIAGGSQGAEALNDIAYRAFASDAGDWIHSTGPKLFDSYDDLTRSQTYRLVPFLDETQMAHALGEASLAIVRAGAGTIAELALFGLPAVYVPLPTSFANHQLYNAQEIAAFGGGSVLEQSELTADRLKAEWCAWRDDTNRRESAAQALRNWAKPDAAERVLSVVKAAVR